MAYVYVQYLGQDIDYSPVFSVDCCRDYTALSRKGRHIQRQRDTSRICALWSVTEVGLSFPLDPELLQQDLHRALHEHMVSKGRFVALLGELKRDLESFMSESFSIMPVDIDIDLDKAYRAPYDPSWGDRTYHRSI